MTERAKDRRKVYYAYQFVGSLMHLGGQKYEKLFKDAECVIGRNFAPDSEARENLIKAVRLNLSEHDFYTYNMLWQKFVLPLGVNQFTVEKKRYVKYILDKLQIPSDYLQC